MRHILLAAALLSVVGITRLSAAENCTADGWSYNHQPGVAETREQHVQPATQTKINPGPNGGIHIHGWDKQDVLVKACIHASAPSQSEASELLKEVQIVRGTGDIEPDGPGGGNRHWNVSYEIWMPNHSNIEADGVNGGITIESLEGDIRFHTQNGGVNLTDVAGDVQGSTQNGGVTIRLNGSSWRGHGLSAETENGGVHLSIPDGYSAHVEAATVNGGMHADFPVMLSGKNLSFNLGSGGAPITLKTVNGGVHITKT